MSTVEQPDPSCPDCHNTNVVRRFTAGTAIHVKADPNFELDRVRHKVNIAAGAEPIDKREADMMSHNAAITRRQQERRMDAEIDKMVESSAMEVLQRRGGNLSEE